MSPPRAAKCKRAAGRVVAEFDTTSGMSSPSFGDGHDRSYGSGALDKTKTTLREDKQWIKQHVS